MYANVVDLAIPSSGNVSPAGGRISGLGYASSVGTGTVSLGTSDAAGIEGFRDQLSGQWGMRQIALLLHKFFFSPS